MATEQPFERIVTEHGAVVLRVCRAVLGRGPDADDAWSETFLAALRAWPDLAPDTNVQAWLVTIAHRKAIDVTRARARRAVPVAEPPERAAAAADPVTDAELWDRVATLPDKQRLALAYHYFGGLPYPQVAELIGGSADAARRAGADGIRALRRALTDL
ncbi:sigma-70 family RNA polymerase sigma factor [Saccharomonospora sp. NPDC006951]